jgi:hypothetical protein
MPRNIHDNIILITNSMEFISTGSTALWANVTRHRNAEQIIYMKKISCQIIRSDKITHSHCKPDLSSAIEISSADSKTINISTKYHRTSRRGKPHHILIYVKCYTSHSSREHLVRLPVYEGATDGSYQWAIYLPLKTSGWQHFSSCLKALIQTDDRQPTRASAVI